MTYLQLFILSVIYIGSNYVCIEIPTMENLSDIFENRIFFGQTFPPDSLQRMTDLVPLVKDFTLSEIVKVLKLSLPDKTPEEGNNFIEQVLPKSIAFGSLLGIEQSKHPELLAKVGTLHALIQIVDHLMDKKDQLMINAVKEYLDDNPAKNINNPRLHLLVAINDTLKSISTENDGSYEILYTEVFNSTFGGGMRISELSEHLFLLEKEQLENYIDTKSIEIAGILVSNTAIIAATSIIYSVYKKICPELPSLKEVLSNKYILDFLYMVSVAGRIWDDLGDRDIDMGNDIEWNSEYINLFNINSYKIIWNMIFWALEGIDNEKEIHTMVHRIHSNMDNEMELDKILMNLVNQFEPSVNHLPEFSTAIMLIKRITEMAYYNKMGDRKLQDIKVAA